VKLASETSADSDKLEGKMEPDIETNEKIGEIVRETIEQFCQEFMKNPYRCYTEHGIHALFYHDLLENIPESLRFLRKEKDGKEICIAQKEYPMADSGGKSRRAHWDIAVLNPFLENAGEPWYDFLKLNSVVEFCLNEGEVHLKDDKERLMKAANIDHKYIVHLFRVSNGESRKDLKPNSARIISRGKFEEIMRGSGISSHYIMVDGTSRHENQIAKII